MTTNKPATPTALDEWAAALWVELGLPGDIPAEINLVLDLARDAAHGVARPAAPVTTFLVGYAAALAGGGRDEVLRAAQIASTLALGWTPAADGNR